MMGTIEQTLREELAAAHHIIHYHGWDDLLATHLSARIPGTDHLLITPMNVAFEAVSASRLIKCDFDGNFVDNNQEHLMPQAINIHGDIYKNSQTIMSAMHTHSIDGVAVSSLECGFLFSNQRALRFYNDVAYHDYDGLALVNEGENIVKSLGHNRVMVLRNHGLVTTGKSIAEACYLLYYLETACTTQIRLLATNAKMRLIPEDICQKTKAQFESFFKPELEFSALMNRIAGKSKVDYKS
jgi:ribulose-5-phosphate 4-epimerase/fuculose-1-phosphate aldolase